jgi:hypothetical protein
MPSMWPGVVGGLVTTLTCANNSFWASRSANFEHAESVNCDSVRPGVLGSLWPSESTARLFNFLANFVARVL